MNQRNKTPAFFPIYKKKNLLEDANPTPRYTSKELLNTESRLPKLRSVLSPFKPNLATHRNLNQEIFNDLQPGEISPTNRISPKPLISTKSINVVTKVGYKTKVGSVKSKPKLNNQDAFIIKPSLRGVRGNYLFGVCDGHGNYGHHVSKYIRDTFPSMLEDNLDRNFNSNTIERSFHVAVNKLCKGLQETGIEIAFSGSTLACVALFGSFCVCGNIGDSRVVLGRFISGQWEALGLSQDHNTKRQDERTRILNSNGRISQSTNYNGELCGPERVWILDENIPGLAMTRSIGDKISKAVGVISDPEVFMKKLYPCDKFIIIASDGVWEHISNEEAVKIVSKHFDTGFIEEATQALVSKALKKWNQNEYVDDITVILIYLEIN